MRATARCLAFAAGLALALTSVAQAQHPQTREGFWIGFGFGYGSAGLTCTSPCAFNSSAKGGGATGYIKLGGTLNSKVLLGGEVNGWTKNISGATPTTTETVGNVSGAVYFYPAPASGFFLKGGVGFADYILSGGGSSVSGSGFGFLAGLGYDIRVGRNVSLTPTANFYFGADGDVSDVSGTAPSVKHTVIDFGLGITFH